MTSFSLLKKKRAVQGRCWLPVHHQIDSECSCRILFLSQEETDDVLVQGEQNYQEQIYGTGIARLLWPLKNCGPMWRERSNYIRRRANKSAIKERDLVTAGGRPAARSSLKKMQLDVLSHQRYINRDYMTAQRSSLNFIFWGGKRTQKWVQVWDVTTKSLSSISNKVSSLRQEGKIAFFSEKIKRNVFLSARSGLTAISENVRQPTDGLGQLDTVFWGARGIAWPPVQAAATTVNSPLKQLGTLPLGLGHPALVLCCQIHLPGQLNLLLTQPRCHLRRTVCCKNEFLKGDNKLEVASLILHVIMRFKLHFFLIYLMFCFLIPRLILQANGSKFLASGWTSSKWWRVM